MTKYFLKHFRIIITFTVFLSAVFLNSCEQDFVNNNPDIIKFPPEIETIFNTPITNSNISCSTPSCHGNENSSGMNLVDWQKAMNGSDNGTMIIPYNGFWSHLYGVVNNDTLIGPVSNLAFSEYHKIDPQNVIVIKNWIDQGAMSADGQVAFTNVSKLDKTFITNQASDLIAVLESDSKRVLRLIPAGGRSGQLDAPHYVKVSPDKNFFYISLIQEGYIEKFDINTDYPFSKLDRLQIGLNPAHIEISPDGSKGYVTNFDASGSERVIRRFSTISPMLVTGEFQDQKLTAPHGMALTANGNHLYIASEIGEYLFKINTDTFINSDSTVIKEPIDPSVPPNGQGTGNFKPYQIVLSHDESKLFVSCRGSNEIRVYRADNLGLIGQIHLGNNSYPLLMKISNDGNYLFTCNRNNNTVSVINTNTLSITSTITGVGIQPHGVDFTKDGQYAIIACETQSGFDGHHPTVGSTKIGVSRIIQMSNFSLLEDRIEMASFPAGIEVVK
ncbi:MAG: beta-propeller fold lactonase family protein [Ignavibacteria bacterium]|nr:beta-propeller fold lactonase family protein [Ignavibacteria bacterium]